MGLVGQGKEKQWRCQTLLQYQDLELMNRNPYGSPPREPLQQCTVKRQRGLTPWIRGLHGLEEDNKILVDLLCQPVAWEAWWLSEATAKTLLLFLSEKFLFYRYYLPINIPLIGDPSKMLALLILESIFDLYHCEILLLIFHQRL